MFSTLLNKVYQIGEAFTRLHAMSGFDKTALFSLNILKVDQSKLQIAETFQEPTEPSTTFPQTPIPMSNTSNAFSTDFIKNSDLIKFSTISLEKAIKKFF